MQDRPSTVVAGRMLSDDPRFDVMPSKFEASLRAVSCNHVLGVGSLYLIVPSRINAQSLPAAACPSRVWYFFKHRMETSCGEI